MKKQFQEFQMDDPLLTGQKIRTERLRRGLTQSDMGEMLGLSTSYISSLERGQRRISWNVGRKLHQCFGISCDYMMETADPISPYGDLLRDPDEEELLHRFQVLLKTCTDRELLICYQMCHSFLSSARQSSIAAALGRRAPSGTADSADAAEGQADSPSVSENGDVLGQ